MKRILFLLGISLIAFSCSPPKSSKSTKDVSVKEAKELISNTSNLLVLDVRTPEEWKLGFIEGATKLNFFDSDFEQKVNQMDNSQAVLVYCKRGGRSAKSTSVLEKAGFKTIYNMLGGYDAYSAAE